ncbi:MAG: pilus assembly protein PilP [Gammaproteobacteria bacterium]|nr:MAG: pilus assembly protein PilP [Gammaproteobacteria bacterium]
MNPQEFIESLNDLDLENVGSWPVWFKALAYFAASVAVAVGMYQLVLSDSFALLERKAKEEVTLKKEYEDKSFKAANLEEYKNQMVEMEESYGSLLRQLPGETEVPGLLEDISHTGLGSGLEFESIDLGKEHRAEFYSELPIDIRISGGYHGFSNFVSGVAALPRIVTLHDFVIEPLGNTPNVLKVRITAKTYRYIDRDEDDEK